MRLKDVSFSNSDDLTREQYEARCRSVREARLAKAEFRVLELRREGATYVKIARATNLRHADIATILNRRGLTRGMTPRVTPEVLQRICQLRGEGWTQLAIANEVGVTQATISEVCRKHNIMKGVKSKK